MLNRICIVLSDTGEISSISADADLTVLIVDPARKIDRVYQYAPDIGPQHVQQHVQGYSVGHIADGTFSEWADGSGRRPPSKPHIGPVK